jgi:hypothetical protein
MFVLYGSLSASTTTIAKCRIKILNINRLLVSRIQVETLPQIFECGANAERPRDLDER